MLQLTLQDADTEASTFWSGFFCVCSRKLVSYLLGNSTI